MNKNFLLGLLILTTFCFAVSAQAPAGQAAQSLPAGDAKAIVETACTTCHAATMITNTGHTPEDWKLLVERMVSAGADVPQNQMAMVTDYLSKNFPERNVPKAVLVPGAVKVTFKEWKAPTVGSRPHDPLATHDGYLWYSGQYANVLGRVDTKTDQIKEFRPTIARSGPHGRHSDIDRRHCSRSDFLADVRPVDPAQRQQDRGRLRSLEGSL